MHLRISALFQKHIYYENCNWVEYSVILNEYEE